MKKRFFPISGRWKATLLLAGVFFHQGLNAQDTLRLSLTNALTLGINNNKSLQAEELNTDIESAKSKQFSSVFYPSVNGNAGLIHYVNIPVQYAQANLLNPKAPSDQYVGLQFQLPNSFGAGVSANWLIYNQAVFSGLKIINEQTAITSIQVEKDKSDLAYTISQLYYGIVFAKMQQENLETIVANMDKLIVLLKSNYQNGTVMKSELDKVTVNRTNISSQIEDISSATEVQSRILKLLLALPPNTAMKLTDGNFEESLHIIADTASGPENTFEYKLMQAQVKMNHLERRVIIASDFPTLGLTYNYSYNSVSPNFDNVLNSKFNFPLQYAGVNLSVPIFNGNANLLKLKENTIEHRQLELQQQFLTQKLSTDIINARLRYNASLANMASNKANVTLAQELYGQSLDQYHQGTMLLTDVLTYETSMEQASTQYFNSVSNALMSLLDYKKSTNTILTK